MNEKTQPDSKVLFRLSNEDGSTDVETLWATHLQRDQYKLENSPFYAYGVSWQDIVHAPFSEEEGFPVFAKVVTKSGNRTIRIIFDPPVSPGNESDKILQGLVTLGCDYEGANKSYIVVNIPPAVALDAVRNYLIDRNAKWEHADPAYDSLFPENS